MSSIDATLSSSMTDNHSSRSDYPDPREEDIMAGDRRLSRPDASLPDWEVPDTAYRPIPIVWFTAAMISQLLVLTALTILLAQISAWLTIGLSGLATGAIAKWTWDRGMQSAGSTWQGATILVLVGQLAFVCLALMERLS